MQMVVVGLGKLTDDSHSKYHQYDGWAGIVVIIIRLGFYIYSKLRENTFKYFKPEVNYIS